MPSGKPDAVLREKMFEQLRGLAACAKQAASPLVCVSSDGCLNRPKRSASPLCAFRNQIFYRQRSPLLRKPEQRPVTALLYPANFLGVRSPSAAAAFLLSALFLAVVSLDSLRR